jgi:hypothetical protein
MPIWAGRGAYVLEKPPLTQLKLVLPGSNPGLGPYASWCVARTLKQDHTTDLIDKQKY